MQCCSEFGSKDQKAFKPHATILKLSKVYGQGRKKVIIAATECLCFLLVLPCFHFAMFFVNFDNIHILVLFRQILRDLMFLIEIGSIRMYESISGAIA